MPPGWDCLVRAPSWPASKPLLSRPGVFREWRLAAGHRAHCTLLAARARAVTPARTPPALPAPMCQRELSKDWPRLSSCGRGVNLCLAPRIARGASLLPRLAPERQPPSLPSLHPKGAVHGLASGLRARASNCRRSIRFSYSPSASLALRVRSVSCVAYPCEGIRRFRCSNPPCALPGAGWTRGVLRVPGVPCDTSHGRLGPRSLARALGCGTPPSPLPPVRRGVETRLAPPRRNNEPRRELRQGKSNERARSRRPGHGARPGCVAFFHRNPKRLSATDISALASMKNVAKCDTWCELQNPVNHRVFERKLRPKPLGRGHVCLGVTHRCPPAQSPLGGRGVGRAETGLPCAPRSRLAEIRVLRRPGRDDRW
ncbi:Protein TAR1 [Melia azedarach]|uniref:Protein TAR1 n=1 Tax=Melia azedarach TaxID=155640 RepID=A0ACC1Y6J1_MELAZ|nr:Protein TAR1 [Melia azedarach]KAJ4699826.1 Protein TAR1 [Melia azedarach]KAJ4699960.1 Protein TAR1 [Melia azedarach]KAJ4700106.1 Protein TAR1 [Melia azedarach]KAJ4700160.1 Protein TAR1 [Melia azedarach]